MNSELGLIFLNDYRVCELLVDGSLGANTAIQKSIKLNHFKNYQNAFSS